MAARPPAGERVSPAAGLARLCGHRLDPGRTRFAIAAMNEPGPIAEARREAGIEAALHAGVSGLGHEDRFGCAVQSIRALDLAAVLRQAGDRAGTDR